MQIEYLEAVPVGDSGVLVNSPALASQCRFLMGVSEGVVYPEMYIVRSGGVLLCIRSCDMYKLIADGLLTYGLVNQGQDGSLQSAELLGNTVLDEHSPANAGMFLTGTWRNGRTRGGADVAVATLSKSMIDQLDGVDFGMRSWALQGVMSAMTPDIWRTRPRNAKTLGPVLEEGIRERWLASSFACTAEKVAEKRKSGKKKTGGKSEQSGAPRQVENAPSPEEGLAALQAFQDYMNS